MKFNLLASASTLAMGGLVALALPGAAHAGLTCTALQCTETVTGSSFLTGGQGLATLDQFNLGGGSNLTSIVISESGSFTSTGSITYTGSGTGVFTYSEIGIMKLTGTSPTSTPAGVPLLTLTGIATPVNYSLASGTSSAYNGAKRFGATSGNVPTIDFSQFVGSGTFTVNFSGAGGASIIGTNSYNASLTTDFFPSASITYNFSYPAPEPASLALMGAGLAGLGVIRRRRKV